MRKPRSIPTLQSAPPHLTQRVRTLQSLWSALSHMDRTDHPPCVVSVSSLSDRPAASLPSAVLMSHLIGGLAGSSGGSFNEVQNQAEFEAARQAWLRSGDALAVPVVKPPPRRKPSTAAGTDAVSIARKGMARPKDRADLLMAETRKMEERLQLLRRTTEAEKEKRTASASKPSSAAAAGLMTTQRIGGGLGGGSLRSVAPRIDTKNTFLSVKETAAREARVAEAARARAAAEEARRLEEETRRLAALRAGGHTLVTYAPSESPQQWVLEREPEEVPFAVAAGLGSRLAPAASPARSGVAPRKQLTAADMLRAKRNGSATRHALEARSAAPAAVGGSAASAAAALRVASSAAVPASSVSSSAVPINRTQFNLFSSPPRGAVSSGCGDDGGLMGSGDLDEAANAEAFAQARMEFLRSLAPAAASPNISAATTNTETDADAAADAAVSSAPAAASGGAALSGDWWAQDDAASSTAAPGSLLNGPAFDEQDSAAAFQAARAQWMQPNDVQAVAAVASSPVAAATSSAAVLAAASSSAVPSSAKSACYTCYKTAPSGAVPGAGFVDSLTGKFFCSESCAAVARAEFRVQCKQCRARIKHAQATSIPSPEQAAAGVKQEWLCGKCAAASSSVSSSYASSAAAASTAALSGSLSTPATQSSLPPQSDEPLISLFGGDEMIAALQARAREPLHAAPKASTATRSSANSRATSASAIHPRPVSKDAEAADADSISAWES